MSVVDVEYPCRMNQRQPSERRETGSAGPLPLPPRVEAPEALRGGSAGEASAAASGDADKIVVVDDDHDTSETLAEALTLDGFDVRTACDGASALNTIAEHTPMCVLTDVSMPGIDGFELARRLRANYGPELVLIAATGWGDPDDRAAARFDDFDFCLRKPIDLQRLRRILLPG